MSASAASTPFVVYSARTFATVAWSPVAARVASAVRAWSSASCWFWSARICASWMLPVIVESVLSNLFRTANRSDQTFASDWSRFACVTAPVAW